MIARIAGWVYGTPHESDRINNSADATVHAGIAGDERIRVFARRCGSAHEPASPETVAAGGKRRTQKEESGRKKSMIFERSAAFLPHAGAADLPRFFQALNAFGSRKLAL